MANNRHKDYNNNNIRHLLSFRPIYKNVLWGGNRIFALKNEPAHSSNVGESWEISGVEGSISVVDGGEFNGESIENLVSRFGADLIGNKAVEKGCRNFPILVKFLDARLTLSLQVHPNDTLAFSRHNSGGKNELWYIIDSADDSDIICGLSAPLTPETYQKAVKDHTILQYTAKYNTQKGHFYYIPAGTLHAIGAGNLILEIQQTSDITYRVYDYNRCDSDGKPRQLHTEEAIDAIDYSFPPAKLSGELHPLETNNTIETPSFNVNFLEAHPCDKHCFKHDGSTFTIIVAVKGSAKISIDGEGKELCAGHTVLVPAAVPSFSIEGDATLLTVTL
ncbi:MAG: class I mannose-6-phosphate isomerase [Muribaculaceae bacterium]|nr:class I mannose-6-phosphate isomerase [Muribaculaceae bacterium]